MQFDMADLKPSLLTLFVFFLMWVVVANLAKWLFTRYQVPYLSDLVLAA